LAAPRHVGFAMWPNPCNIPDIRTIAHRLQQPIVATALATDAIAVAMIAVAIVGSAWRTLRNAWTEADGRRLVEEPRLRPAVR